MGNTASINTIGIISVYTECKKMIEKDNGNLNLKYDFRLSLLNRLYKLQCRWGLISQLEKMVFNFDGIFWICYISKGSCVITFEDFVEDLDLTRINFGLLVFECSFKY